MPLIESAVSESPAYVTAKPARRFQQGQYGTKYKAPKVVVAKVDDDMESLANRVGVDPLQMSMANPDATNVQAGAAYTIPWPDYNVPIPEQDYFGTKKLIGETDSEYAARMERLRNSGAIPGGPESEPEPETDINWGWDYWKKKLGGGNVSGGPAETTTTAVEWLRDLIWGKQGDDEQSAVPPGVGMGAGAMIGTTLMGGQDAGTGGGWVDDRAPQGPNVDPYGEISGLHDPAPVPIPGNIGPYDLGGPGYQQPRQPVTPQPGSDEYYDWLVENSPYTPGTPEFFAWVNEMADPLSYGGPLSPSESDGARDFSPEAYADPNNPLYYGRGRGAGIVGWIEERTGFDVDPETFFTEGKSEELLDAIAKNFSPEEQAYLVTHGILVPDTAPDLPAYSPPSYGKTGGDYSYPLYYGNSRGSSGPTYQRQPILGLTSWSI